MLADLENSVATVENYLVAPPKVNQNYHMTQQFHLEAYTPRELKTRSNPNLSENVHGSTTACGQGVETTQTSLN